MMMLQNRLRNELTYLNREDRIEIAHWLLTTVVAEPHKNGAENGMMLPIQLNGITKPSLWIGLSPAERSQELRTWIATLPKHGTSLPDEAFDRGSIYE